MNYEELAIAIDRTHRELADAKGDDVRACLYYHLDKLLDLELAYFGAPPLMQATESEPEEEEPSDEEKIAAAVAAGKVTPLPAKHERKRQVNRSARSRWEQSERLRKMKLKDRYTPVAFEDSKFYSAEPASASQETVPAYIRDFQSPDPIEDDDGVPIQIGGIELRP